MQSIFAYILGLLITAFMIGMIWKWILKPFVSLPVRVFKLALGKSFLVGVSVGDKLALLKPKKVITPEGEVDVSTAFMDQFSVPEYEMAEWVKSHHIKKCGYVLFRGYTNHVARCFVVVGNSSFQNKHGKRIQLPKVMGTYKTADLFSVNDTTEEVTKMVLDSVSKIESPAPVVLKEKPVVVEEVKEPVVDTVAKAVVPEQMPIAESSVKKQKPLESYKGYLISYGKAIRHISSSSKTDGNDDSSGREIEQFRVVIRDEEGVEESIWGQDLLRAMKDANILVNDMVEVIKTGKRQIGTSWKNLYAIHKLA